MTRGCGVASTSLFRVADELAFCAGDSRWRVRDLSLTDGGHKSARLILVFIDRPESLSASFRSDLNIGIEDAAGPVCMIGGGLAQRRSIGYVCSCRDELSSWRELFTQGLAEAAAVGAHPLLTYLTPGAQTTAALDAARHAHSVGHEDWSTLTLLPDSEIATAWAGAPRKVRQAWARDLRDFEKLGLSQSVEPMTDANIELAAPLLSAVSEHNGLRQPPALSRMVLRSLRARPGLTILVQTRDRHGQIVAMTACRIFRDILDVYAVGILPAHDDRRSVYHAAVFIGPVRLAMKRGCRHVQFGFRHPDPKRRRGCTVERVVTLLAAQPDP